MKKFGRTVCSIAIPVTLQCMLQSSFSIVDQLMIGQLGKNSIEAVGLGGNISLIISVVIGAIGTVAGILISQFLGAENEKEAWSGFTVSTVFGVVVAACFMLASIFFTKEILGFYTNNMSTITEGIPYLRLIAYTFIPMAVSSVVSTWLRCIEHATIPLIASFVAVICNTGLNYVLIFGKFGMRALGISGAGYATVMSQLLNLTIMIIGFLYCLRKENKKMQLSLHFEKVSFSEYMVMIMPILISEFLWSLGQNVFSAVYGHLREGSLAAYTLTAPIQGLCIGALSGLAAAAGVIVGKQLGGEEYDEAFESSKKLMLVSFVGAAVLSAVLIVLSNFYVSLYNVGDSIKSVARMLLIVFALYAPVKVLNMVLGGGIIRSGGNTRIIMIIDIIGTWAVGVPLCFFAAYVLKGAIVTVYAILSFEEVVRLAITYVMFLKKSWMKTIA